MKPDPKLEMIGHNVVIDNGTYTVKGGFSDNDAPTCSLPCLVGHGRHKGAMSSLGLKETYVGCAAQKLRGILDISHPIRQGSVQNWDDLEVLWSHILETELKTEGGAQPIIMTQPPLASQQEEDTMAEILVEKLGVPAFFIANKSVMSLYGGGQMTGIAVDSGHDTTYIVPSYQGNPVQEATLVLRLGGRHVTEQLMNQLLNGKYSFPDDNFMLWRKKKKTNFTVSSRKEIVREMKEQYCTVTTNYNADWADVGYHEESVRLPDGNMIVMGKETFLAPEIMFQPSLANKKSIGIPELIYNSLMKCDKAVRAELLANITLSGGNTKFPGMEKRVYQELEALLPVRTLKDALKVRALPHRDILGWVGAARLSQLSSFQRFWVTPADYREDGSSVSVRSSRLFDDLRNSNASLPTTTV